MKIVTKDKLLFKIFWKLKDEIIKCDDGNCKLQTVILPRFGKLGVIIWFILVDDNKWIIEDKND